MAVAIPAGCYRQPTESEGRGAGGEDAFAYVLKGPYTALETLLRSLSRGEEIVEGWLMAGANLARNPGDTGTLTITCAVDNEDAGASGTPSEYATKALNEVWSLRSVRNDVSVMAYCGPSPGANPLREIIEAWQKEPDGELANQTCYRRADGSVFSIANGEMPATVALIEKIRRGIDSVMRFYPQLTRTYSRPPARVYENLATIDVPTVGSTTDFEVTDGGTTTTKKADTSRLEKPGNLGQIITDHEWLKCQDDTGKTPDGKFSRVESWIGVPKTDGGWDVNLYGRPPDRWAMPYQHQ